MFIPLSSLLSLIIQPRSGEGYPSRSSKGSRNWGGATQRERCAIDQIDRTKHARVNMGNSRHCGKRSIEGHCEINTRHDSYSIFTASITVRERRYYGTPVIFQGRETPKGDSDQKHHPRCPNSFANDSVRRLVKTTSAPLQLHYAMTIRPNCPQENFGQQLGQWYLASLPRFQSAVFTPSFLLEGQGVSFKNLAERGLHRNDKVSTVRNITGLILGSTGRQILMSQTQWKGRKDGKERHRGWGQW